MNRRRTGIDKDVRNWTYCVLVSITLGIFLLACVLAFVAQAGELPASVLVTERNYTQGVLVHECWLDTAHYGAIGTGYGLIVECHSDIDGLFKNGFEVTP